MILLYNKLEDILTTIYYWSVIDVSNLMVEELNQIHVLIDKYSLLFCGFEILTFLIGIWFFWMNVNLVMENCYSVFCVLPLVIVKENLELLHRLQMVRKAHVFF